MIINYDYIFMNSASRPRHGHDWAVQIRGLWCRFGLTRSGGWAILRRLSDEGPSGFRIGLDPVVTVIVESCPAPSRTPEPAAPQPRRVGRSRQEDRTSWTRLAVSPLERIERSRQPLEQDTDGHAPELVGGRAGRVDVVVPPERGGGRDVGRPRPARDHLAQGDASAAVTDLEDALPVAASPPERDQLLGLLREAYESAARQAETTGRTQEAEMYRDNLAIIDRRPAAGPVTMSVSPSAGVPSADLSSAPTPLPPVNIPDKPRPLPRSAPIAPPLTPEPEPTAVAPTAPTPAAPGLTPAPEPEPTSPAPPAPSPAALRAELAAADAAFVAGKYDDAGRMYEALERAPPVAQGAPRLLGLLPLRGGRPPVQCRTEDPAGMGESQRRDPADPR